MPRYRTMTYHVLWMSVLGFSVVGCSGESKEESAFRWTRNSIDWELSFVLSTGPGEAREDNAWAELYEANRLHNTQLYLAKGHPQDAIYFIYARAYVADKELGPMIHLRWLEFGRRAVGITLYGAERGDRVKSLPVFDPPLCARKEPLKGLDESVAYKYEAFVPVSRDDCRVPIIGQACPAWDVLSNAKVCVPAGFFASPLEVSLYDTRGQESNRVKVFCYESFREAMLQEHERDKTRSDESVKCR